MSVWLDVGSVAGPFQTVLLGDCAGMPKPTGGLATYPGGVVAALAPVEYMVSGEYGHGIPAGT